MDGVGSVARIAIACMLAIALGITLAACGSGAESDSGDNPSTTQEPSPDAGDLKASLQSQPVFSENWDYVREVRLENRLLTQVMIVDLELPTETAQNYELTSSLLSEAVSVADGVTDNVMLRSVTDGMMLGASGGGEGPESLGLPAPPSDATALAGWFDEVFADSGEMWYSQLKNISLQSDVPGWPGVDMLVIETTIQPDDPMRFDTADLTAQAVALSGQTFASYATVLDSTGGNLRAGELAPLTFGY